MDIKCDSCNQPISKENAIVALKDHRTSALVQVGWVTLVLWALSSGVDKLARQDWFGLLCAGALLLVGLLFAYKTALLTRRIWALSRKPRVSD